MCNCTSLMIHSGLRTCFVCAMRNARAFPLLPAALVSVPFGFVLVRFRTTNHPAIRPLRPLSKVVSLSIPPTLHSQCDSNSVAFSETDLKNEIQLNHLSTICPDGSSTLEAKQGYHAQSPRWIQRGKLVKEEHLQKLEPAPRHFFSR